MRCRQLEKILFPLELTVFFAQPVEFSALVARQLALIGGSDISAIDAGLPDPLGQGAVGHAQSLGNSPAAQTLSEAELYSLLLLQRRELAPGLRWIGHRWTV